MTAMVEIFGFESFIARQSHPTGAPFRLRTRITREFSAELSTVESESPTSIEQRLDRAWVVLVPERIGRIGADEPVRVLQRVDQRRDGRRVLDRAEGRDRGAAHVLVGIVRGGGSRASIAFRLAGQAQHADGPGPDRRVLVLQRIVNGRCRLGRPTGCRSRRRRRGRAAAGAGRSGICARSIFRISGSACTFFVKVIDARLVVGRGQFRAELRLARPAARQRGPRRPTGIAAGPPGRRLFAGPPLSRDCRIRLRKRPG